MWTKLIRTMLDRRQSWIVSRHIYTSARYRQETASTKEEESAIDTQMTISKHVNQRETREPFMKNVFLGKVDSEFLAYPEAQTTERYNEFKEWIKEIESYLSQHANVLDMDESVKKEIFSMLISMHVLKARVETTYNGLNLNETEICRLTETLSVIPWLGVYFTKNYLIPVNIISKYGTEMQKAKYLPKIATGNIIPSFCSIESLTGTCTKDMDTNAILSEDSNVWILNGRKTYVANALNSNLFIVIAKTGHAKRFKEIDQARSLSAFIVEQDFGGITCEHVEETIGQSNVPMSVVKFTNTFIPKENIIGHVGIAEEILINVHTPGNQNIAGQAIGILKNFINLLTSEILHRKHLDKNMYQYESVQGVLADMACTLYTMESVAYLTTGMADNFKNQDVELEKAITEHYCANQCLEKIYQGLQLIGAQSYLKDSPYAHILQDALMLTIFERYNMDAETFIALLGIQHVGKHIHEEISKRRTRFFTPEVYLKFFISNKRYTAIKGNLEQFLHPSFRQSAISLQESLSELFHCSASVLEFYGTEVAERQMQLAKLCEFGTLVYIFIATLGRASRAYCNGNRYNDSERIITLMYCQRLIQQTAILKDHIMSREMRNGQETLKSVAEILYKDRKYHLMHPLERTF